MKSQLPVYKTQQKPVLKSISLVASHAKVSKLYFYKCAHFLLFLTLSTIFIYHSTPIQRLSPWFPSLPLPIPPFPAFPPYFPRSDTDSPHSHHSHPDFLHFHPDCPHSHHSHLDSLHSKPDSAHSHHFHPDSPHFHLDSPYFHHSPYSVPRFPIKRLLQTDSQML